MKLTVGCMFFVILVQNVVMVDMIGEFKKLRTRIEAIEASPYVVPPSNGRKRPDKNLRQLPFSKPPTSEKIVS